MDRITKGDVLVGPDVAKRLAMGLSCLNPLKPRAVLMSDIAVKNSKYVLPKAEIHTFFEFFILVFIVTGIPV